MKVLITGAHGLVGKAFQWIVQQFPQDTHQYVYLSRKEGDLTSEAEVQKIFETYQPDAVIHLAANVGGLFKNMHQRAEMYEENILMNTLLLKYCRIYKVSKVILMLSTCIFPDGLQVSEEALHRGPPHPSNEGYAYAKRMMEVHGRILQEEHGITTICITPTNIYGPFDNFQLDNAHVVPALIHKCYLAKKEQKPFVVCGSGRPLRQFIYSFDLANILYVVLSDHKVPSGHYICAPPSQISEISIETAARTIAKAMNYEAALTFDTSYADGQFKKTVQPHPLVEDLPFTEFEKGIQVTVAWFLDQMQKPPSERTLRI